MAEATKSKPAEPAPQPDRSHVVPLLNRLEQLRMDLTKVANWLFVHWPDGPRPLRPRADVSYHYGADETDDLRAGREVLALLGDVQVSRDGTYGEAKVDVGDVRVAVQAYRRVWDEAFPEEAAE